MDIFEGTTEIFTQVGDIVEIIVLVNDTMSKDFIGRRANVLRHVIGSYKDEPCEPLLELGFSEGNCQYCWAKEVKIVEENDNLE